MTHNFEEKVKTDLQLVWVIVKKNGKDDVMTRKQYRGDISSVLEIM